MKTLALLLVSFSTIGCDDKKEIIPTHTDASSVLEIRTVKHDGHTWVTANTGYSNGGVSILHHPDCACWKVSK